MTSGGVGWRPILLLCVGPSQWSGSHLQCRDHIQWLRIQEVGEVRSLAFALPSNIRELPSFSGQTPKFSWRLDLTCDQNGLELLNIYNASPFWVVLLTYYICPLCFTELASAFLLEVSTVVPLSVPLCSGVKSLLSPE